MKSDRCRRFEKNLQSARLIAGGLLVALVIEGFPVFPTRCNVKAVTTQELIHQTNIERDELEEQLGEEQDNIAGLKGEKNTLMGELRGLNEELRNIGENLEELEEDIDKKEQQIEEIRKELEKIIETEETQYDSMVYRMQSMYEVNSENYLSLLLTAGSFSEILNMADWFEKIALYDQRKLQEFKETRLAVEETQKRLEDEKIQLENLKLNAEAEKNKVSGLISRTSNNIESYADEIEDAEARALQYEQELKQKEEELEDLQQKLREELAMSQNAANGAWRDISQVTFSEGDRKLIANLIYCEAGAEPYDGQLAVGSVIINRVLSAQFPDNVVGVIYQNGQFSPVRSGRLELALAADRATADCYKAADEAMSGKTNVGTCVYFRTPVPGLTGIQIGGHIFY